MIKKQVIDYFGSQEGIVQALNAAGIQIGKSAVCQWRDIIPEVWALHLDRITCGHLKYNSVYYHIKKREK